jgi:hypothetical protein
MGTTLTWFGGIGRFDNPNDWNPTGVPQSGDTAVITTGTVTLRNEGISGVGFELQGTSEATQPVLKLTNVALNSNFTVTGPQPGGTSPGLFGKFDVAGVVTSSGDITLGGGRFGPAAGFLTIDLDNRSAFVNTGTITLDNGHLMVTDGGEHDGNNREHRDQDNGHHARAGSVFFNDGTVDEVFAGSATFDTPVIGTGKFLLSGSSLEFVDSVSRGITVDTRQGQFNNQLFLDEPMRFKAAITDFGTGLPNSIVLPHTDVTSERFANNHLKLFDDDKLVANLNIIGDFTTQNFLIMPGPSGTGTEIQFSHAASGVAQPDTSVSIPVMPDS